MYQYQTNEVGFCYNQIDLLREGYAYKVIDYADVTRIIIKRGYVIKNWIFSLVFSLVLILTSSFMILNLIVNIVEFRNLSLILFMDGSKGFGIMAVVFLMAFGVYGSIISLKKSLIMIVYTENKSYFFSLEFFLSNGNISNFLIFIKNLKITNITIPPAGTNF